MTFFTRIKNTCLVKAENKFIGFNFFSFLIDSDKFPLLSTGDFNPKVSAIQLLATSVARHNGIDESHDNNRLNMIY